MGGFECSDQLNAFGVRVDLLKATRHVERADEDYANLRALNISTVREGIRWSVVEKKPYQYDFADALALLLAAQKQGIQIVWDVCHFGYADDLTPLHPMFARRFAHLCRAFVRFLHTHLPGEPIVITPINEASFISWLGGEVKGTAPYCTGYGWQVKYELMRAYIEGVRAIKEVDPSATILSTEPLVNISEVAAGGDGVAVCYEKNEAQFEVLDILTGRKCPELGGDESLLDVVGLNYYYNNQWLHPANEPLCWQTRDRAQGWKPLHVLAAEVVNRYERPIIISETSHPGEDRPLWMDYIFDECSQMLEAGLPLEGVCIYPIIDRPDWDFTDRWHKSGIWDIFDTQSLDRVLHEPTYHALQKIQQALATKPEAIFEIQ